MASDRDLTAALNKELACNYSAILLERVPSSATIVIAQPTTLDILREFVGEKANQSSPPIFFATAEDLQDVIEDIRFSTANYILNLFVNPDVQSIMFHVPAHFNQLRVIRCNSHLAKGFLLIDGSSTYADIRLDEWDSDNHPDHKLTITREKGIRIRSANSRDEQPSRHISIDFHPQEEKNRDALDDSVVESRWDKIKGRIATGIGGFVAFARLLQCSDTTSWGALYRYNAFGYSSFGMGFSRGDLGSILTTTGNAVTLGLAAGASVYYIPWSYLLGELKGWYNGRGVIPGTSEDGLDMRNDSEPGSRR